MRGIIFDLDDTLYRRADFVRSGFEAIARYLAHSWRREQDAVFASLMAAHTNGWEGREFQALCEAHRLPQGLVPTLISVFRTHTPSVVLPVDVRTTLQQLRQSGWRLVVLTNGDPEVQRRKVTALGIEALVDGVVFAEAHATGGKPDPAAFQAALGCMRLSPSRCICVGDDPLCDIEGARRLGMRTIQTTAYKKCGSPSGNADAVVASMIEVPACAQLLLSETADAA